VRPSPVLDQIIELLESDDDATVNTSMRLPVALRDAAALAVEHLGVAPSTTTLTTTAHRALLETTVMESALGAHYRVTPALPAIPCRGCPCPCWAGWSALAQRRDIIERAAAEETARRPNADADDVLLWAEARAAATA